MEQTKRIRIIKGGRAAREAEATPEAVSVKSAAAAVREVKEVVSDWVRDHRQRSEEFRRNYSTLLGGPLGEEPGWRGYALPRLQTLLGPVRSSLVLGLLWTGWHLPLLLYQGWTSSPLWIYVLFLTGQSVIMTYGTNLARFGVITPIAMHAAFNTVSRFLGGLFAESQPSAPIPFVLVMALCGLALALFSSTDAVTR